MENHSLLRDETNSQKLFQHAFYITNKEECLCFSIFSIRAVKTRLCATAINRRLNMSEVRWGRWERRAPEGLWVRKAQLARQELQVPSVQREQRVQPGRKGLKASKAKPVRRAQPDRKVLPDLKARKEYRVKRERPVLKVPSVRKVRKESRAQARCKTHCMPTAVRKP